MSGQNRNGERNSASWWPTLAGVVGAGALVAGGVYIARRNANAAQDREQAEREQARRDSELANSSIGGSMASYLSGLLERVNLESGCGPVEPQGGGRVPNSSVPDNPVINNLNALLADIYVRYVALRDDDFQLHYRVFNEVFDKIHKTMKDVDPYYQRYSSKVQFAGSHFDRLRIKKPDEFDMDINIGLPLNFDRNTGCDKESDIVFEPGPAGFVQLRMGTQFQNLPKRDTQDWQINKTAYKWKDDNNYLLRSKFLDWFKSVVDRALNRLPGFQVDGVLYVVGRRLQSGPAITLYIENRGRGFKLDVDLVPAIRFPESRWPISSSYRSIPAGCSRSYWMVVPKPVKGAPLAEQRAWRLAMHEQERGLLYNTYNLRQTIRLLKKLRDSLEMKKISSYYVKTIFFWEVMKLNEPSFWRDHNLSFLFHHMVKCFHGALVAKKIPYFWNKNNNLIGSVSSEILAEYERKLASLLEVLERPADYKQVARFLLTPHEFREYNARFLHI